MQGDVLAAEKTCALEGPTILFSRSRLKIFQECRLNKFAFTSATQYQYEYLDSKLKAYQKSGALIPARNAETLSTRFLWAQDWFSQPSPNYTFMLFTGYRIFHMYLA